MHQTIARTGPASTAVGETSSRWFSKWVSLVWKALALPNPISSAAQRRRKAHVARQIDCRELDSRHRAVAQRSPKDNIATARAVGRIAAECDRCRTRLGSSDEA